MSERVKNYLGWAIILAVLAIGYSSISYVRSFAKTIRPDSFRSFAVSAEGRAVAIPDVAKFDFMVLNQGGKDIAALRADNEKKVNQAIDFLKKQGVDKADIKTASYNLTPRYQNYACDYRLRIGGAGAGEPCPPPVIVGYEVSQNVAVKVRRDNFSKVGEILAGVITAGANTVSQLQFTVDDPAEVENEARAEAIEKAKAKAKATATAAGFSLGRLLSIEEGGDGYLPYAAYGKGGYGGDALVAREAAAPPVIEPGSEEVTATVLLRYEIE